MALDKNVLSAVVRVKNERIIVALGRLEPIVLSAVRKSLDGLGHCM